MILSTSISQLFFLGGAFQMILLTFLLATVFFAAWKAPRWVDDIGSISLGFSVLFSAFNFARGAKTVLECNGEIHPAVIWGGIRCTAILLAYGLIIFIISRFVYMIQEPRL